MSGPEPVADGRPEHREPAAPGAGPPPAAAPVLPRAELVVALLAGALAVVTWAIWPSAGNYDNVLNLVWAREVLDGAKPGFEAYAASTPHPGWLALGIPLVAVLGDDADLALVLVGALSLAVLAAATVRLGRLAIPADARAGAAAGVVAGVVTLSSFAFLLLAERGYLDVPFMALVAWAGAFAIARPGSWRGPAVLLAVAGLLRPEAWLLAGLHWLWCTARGPWAAGDERLGGRLPHLALVLAAPVLWAAVDLIVTGDPLHSLTATSALADQLGRERGIAAAPRVLVSSLVDQARPPVVPAAVVGALVLLAGVRRRGGGRTAVGSEHAATVPATDAAPTRIAALGLPPVPRRTVVVLGTLLLSGMAAFAAAGVAGLSLLPRYLSVPVVTTGVLAAVAATAWIALPDGARGRRPWAIVVAVAVVLGAGGYVVLKRSSFERLGSELRFASKSRTQVRDLLDDPAVRRGIRCGPLSFPTYRLVPDARLQLDLGADRVVARSDPRAIGLGIRERGVAIAIGPGLPSTRYGKADGVPQSTQPVPRGFRVIARRGPFLAAARCPAAAR